MTATRRHPARLRTPGRSQRRAGRAPRRDRHPDAGRRRRSRVLPGAASAEQINAWLSRSTTSAEGPAPTKPCGPGDGQGAVTDMRRTVALCRRDRHAVGRLRVHHERPGGEGSYACKAPVGSAVHLGLGRTRLRSTASRPPPRKPKPAKGAHEHGSRRDGRPASTAAPGLGAPPSALRSQPRVCCACGSRLGGRRRRPARGLGGARAGRHRPLADRARHPANRQSVDAVRPPSRPGARLRPASASEPASSPRQRPIAFPAHGSAARQWRDPGAPEPWRSLLTDLESVLGREACGPDPRAQVRPFARRGRRRVLRVAAVPRLDRGPPGLRQSRRARLRLKFVRNWRRRRDGAY